MKTRACLWCGKRIELRRKSVWGFNHEVGRVVRTPTGPFPSAEERDRILMWHEEDCHDRQILREYGEAFPLEKWGVSRT